MNICHVDFRHNMKHIKINSSKIIALLLAFSIIFLYGCDIQSLTWQSSETVDEVVKNIENNKSELDMAAVIIMKKTDNMTEEEKSIFYKYSRIVYVEVVIDGKHCYFKAQV